MIYFFHGTDIDTARSKAHDLINSLRKKKPDASYLKMDGEHFSVSELDSYIEGQGLFENKYIVFLDRLCENKTIKEEFTPFIKEIAESENIFIILEGKLDKATINKIEGKAEKTREVSIGEKVKKEEYNAFALADAFGRRDKKGAWILYRQAIDRGEAPEALQGMLFWKIKTMILNSSYGSYSKDELYSLIHKLIIVYHDSRRGIHELETGLESLILSV